MLELYKDGQPIFYNMVNNAIKNNKLSHAYIFDSNGNPDVMDIVLSFVKEIICIDTTDDNNIKNICKRIDDGNYVDVKVIKSDGMWIKKDQLLDLQSEFNNKAFEGNKKIYIIRSAEKMNVQTANSILKFLEEPIPNRYAFLTTNNHSRMLDTIVSRCQTIHFKPIPKEYLVEQLKSFGVESDIAYVISYLTTETDVAMKYIEDGKVLNYLTVAKKIIDKDLKNKDPYIEYYRNRQMFIEEKDKTYHRFFLDVLVLIYQELLKKANNMNEKYFVDILNILQPEEIDKEQIINKLELINLYQERFNYYVNIDLQYASLFSKL